MADSNEEEAARFRELVHSLPVELFDEIFDYFILVEEEGEVKIDQNYRPPVQLQVDWATCEEFAEDYYKNTIFTGLELDKDYEGCKNIISRGLDMKEAETATVAAWLSSLSRKHRSLCDASAFPALLRSTLVGESTGSERRCLRGRRYRYRGATT